MKNKTVSVIVTCYNCEKYVAKTINSLLNQTYKLNEIILIDDYSKDKTLEVLKKYTKKNNNIKLLINKENKGVSYSRNLGIKNASSEFLMFCDGDDWYDNNAVEILMNAQEDNNADYVVAGYNISYDNGKKIPIKFNGMFKNKVVTKEECISIMPITSCSKLIKKDIIVKNNLQYEEDLKNCEELSIIPVAAFFANKVICIEDCIYNYFQRKNSASNKKLTNLNFFEKSYNYFKDRIPKEYSSSICQRMVEHIIYSKTLVLIKNKADKKILTKHIEECKKEIKGQKINKILLGLPLRKKIFVLCTLNKQFFFLKLYVKLQVFLMKE